MNICHEYKYIYIYIESSSKALFRLEHIRLDQPILPFDHDRIALLRIVNTTTRTTIPNYHQIPTEIRAKPS